MRYSLGRKPDTPDPNDYKFASKAGQVLALPKRDTLIVEGIVDPWDQEDIGSCTAHGTGFLAWYLQFISEYKWKFKPSFLHHYYNTRVLEGTTRFDSGAQIRTAIKALAKFGVCPDYLWPYQTRKFKQKPPERAYESSLLHQATEYSRVPQTWDDIRYALSVERLPIVYGFEVYSNIDSQETRETGILRMPARKHKYEGGHCVTMVGYDEEHPVLGRATLNRNSWGTKWGEGGYFWMPAEYNLSPKLSSDFWLVANSEELTWAKENS